MMFRANTWKCLCFSNYLHRGVRKAKFHANTNGGYGCRPKEKIPIRDDTRMTRNRIHHSNLYRFVTAYRTHGHKKANVDPLSTVVRPHVEVAEVTELDLSNYGLDNVDLNSKVKLVGLVNIPGKDEASYKEIIDHLEKVYCGELSVELHHLQDENEKLWFSNLVEESIHWKLDSARQKHIAKLLLRSQVFDNFLAKKFVTVKRYSAEGAESFLVFYDELFLQAANNGFEQLVLAMPHRGRLSLLTGLLQYPLPIMFSKMKDKCEFPPGTLASGDVLSHLTNSLDLDLDSGAPLHVTMIPNPSHLEACCPVAIGKTRAKQRIFEWGEYGDSVDTDKALCVLGHGDAAFTGQGITAETFEMARLPHYDIHGTIHLITNNQLGFTTPAHQGRSSMYASDIAKIIDCPIIHVNGDYPEEVLRACRLAMEYRKHFKKDVVVDMNCYRRWGHNEVDDPSFTQPSMYNAIEDRKSVPDSYAEYLQDIGVVTHDAVKGDAMGYTAMLNEGLKKADSIVPQALNLKRHWSGMSEASPSTCTSWDTGVSLETLLYVGAKSVEVPNDFNIHPHLLKTHVEARVTKLIEGTSIDWATAEALAIGSLLYQGYHARISGQDVARGTFSHRHAMLVDQKTDEMHIPLNHIKENQTAFLEVCNSHLSEEAVLAFEYGMSIEHPDHLVIWEAQFGDFFNCAQSILDSYVASGETKWLLQTGLVMLLPHGYDGGGPEHSSCRIERFLQFSDSKEDDVDGDSVNIHVVNPTTPAQYFHLLRQQMIRNFRKPLVVVGPKLLLRLPSAKSSLHDMEPGTHFLPVLGDPSVNGPDVRRVVFCSGKHYYALNKKREEINATDTAIIRLEALTPFPADLVKAELQKYPAAKEFIWSQEEHRNMGAWSFVSPRFENILGVKLQYVGRQVLAAPAVGIAEVHHQENTECLQKTFSVK